MSPSHLNAPPSKRRSTGASPLLLLAAVAVAAAAAVPVATAVFTVQAVLTGPTEAWAYAVGGSAPALTTTVKAAICTDIAAATYPEEDPADVACAFDADPLLGFAALHPAGAVFTAAVTPPAGAPGPEPTTAASLAALKASSMTATNTAMAALLGNGVTRVIGRDTALYAAAATPVVATRLVGLSGPSFIWAQTQTSTTDPVISALLSTLLAPLWFDVQAAVDGTHTKLITDLTSASMIVNNTGCYVGYSIYPLTAAGSSSSAATVAAAVFAAPLTLMSARVTALASVSPFSDVADFFPTTLVFTNHPLPLPAGSGNDDSVLPVVRNVTCVIMMYFSGIMAGWATAMTTQVSPATSAFEGALLDGIDASLVRSGFSNSAALDSLSFVPIKAGRNGDDLWWLQAVVTVTQGETAVSVHTFSADAVASIIASRANFTVLLDLYTPSGGGGGAVSIATVTPSAAATAAAAAGAPVVGSFGGGGERAVLLAVGVYGSYGTQCVGSCVGMVVMAAVAGLLMLLTFVVGAVILCCCCRGCGPQEEGKTAGSVRGSEINRNPVFVGTTPAHAAAPGLGSSMNPLTPLTPVTPPDVGFVPYADPIKRFTLGSASPASLNSVNVAPGTAGDDIEMVGKSNATSGKNIMVEHRLAEAQAFSPREGAAYTSYKNNHRGEDEHKVIMTPEGSVHRTQNLGKDERNATAAAADPDSVLSGDHHYHSPATMAAAAATAVPVSDTPTPADAKGGATPPTKKLEGF